MYCFSSVIGGIAYQRAATAAIAEAFCVIAKKKLA